MKSSNPANQTRGTILVVDDEPDLLVLLRERLSLRGYHVLSAENGIAALNVARRELPDLILLDIMLGDMDGLTVCEILRTQPSTARTPVIIMTAMQGEIMRLNSFAAGAMDFIGKPVQFCELLARLETMLARLRQPGPAADSDAALVGDDLVDPVTGATSAW